jgi:hypothetical protein
MPADRDNRGVGELPSGTITMLFSDIEGSTALLNRLGERYWDALSAQRALIRAAIAASHGREMGTEGGSLLLGLGLDVDVSVVGADGHEEVMKEALEPGQAEGMGPWLAEPDRRIPGKVFAAVGDREADVGQRTGGFQPADVELFCQAGGQLDSGERGEFRAHPGSQRAGVQQAFHRRSREPFQRDVDDRKGGRAFAEAAIRQDGSAYKTRKEA